MIKFFFLLALSTFISAGHAHDRIDVYLISRSHDETNLYTTQNDFSLSWSPPLHMLVQDTGHFKVTDTTLGRWTKIQVADMATYGKISQSLQYGLAKRYEIIGLFTGLPPPVTGDDMLKCRENGCLFIDHQRDCQCAVRHPAEVEDERVLWAVGLGMIITIMIGAAIFTVWFHRRNKRLEQAQLAGGYVPVPSKGD